jgi:hypothetical protein
MGVIKSEVKYNFSWICALDVIQLAKNRMGRMGLAAISVDLVSVAAKAPPKSLNQMTVTQSLSGLLHF